MSTTALIVIFHVHDVTRLINSVEALVLFLPPYSPDLMPMELCFSKVKYFLREHKQIAQSIHDIKILILASITSSDCHAWSCECGY